MPSRLNTALGIIYAADPTKGTPIFNGSIYFGAIDTDPTVLGNQIPIWFRQDGNPDVLGSQPVLLSAGGVPLYNGSPVQVFVEVEYSMSILDANGALVYYIPNLTGTGGSGLLDSADIGVTVQAYGVNLDALSGLVGAADQLPYFTAAGTMALATLTAAGRALIDDINAAAQRVTMGVEIGVDVQAYDADIATVAASQAEMEAGTEAALRSMSPLRVTQAIDASSLGQPTVVNNTGASPSVAYLASTVTCVTANARQNSNYDGVYLQVSPDGSTGWVDVARSQNIGPGGWGSVTAFIPAGKYWRAAYVGGADLLTVTTATY